MVVGFYFKNIEKKYIYFMELDNVPALKKDKIFLTYSTNICIIILAFNNKLLQFNVTCCLLIIVNKQCKIKNVVN